MDGGGYKERVQEGDYDGDIMDENGKMRPVETIPGMGVRGEFMIYCKNFC
jgi:hypothetical protein